MIVSVWHLLEAKGVPDGFVGGDGVFEIGVFKADEEFGLGLAAEFVGVF